MTKSYFKLPMGLKLKPITNKAKIKLELLHKIILEKIKHIDKH